MRTTEEKSMLASFMAAIGVAVALVLPHAHATKPAHAATAHVSAFDGNGGGPPTRP
jgi:hypothetical protein